MKTYINNSSDVELADVQDTVAVLEEKLEYWKKNYPYATKEIYDMEVALNVLWDIETDVANKD